jgi:hypothetical protein
VTLKILIKNDSPVNFMKMPNGFRMSFSNSRALWGIRLDARSFTQGILVIRVDGAISEKARPKGFVEIKATGERSRYRFFALAGGQEGTVDELTPKLSDVEVDSAVRMYYHVFPRAKPGLYQVVLAQTANTANVGSYDIAIAVPKSGGILYVADARTRAIYDLKKNPEAIRAIPYEQLAVFTGAGLAVQEKYRFSPEGEADFMAGNIENEIANIPKGYCYPKRPTEIRVHEDGLIGAIVGKVVDKKGVGIEGVKVELFERDKPLGSGISDSMGRYLIPVRTEARTINVGGRKGKRVVELAIGFEAAGKGRRVRTKLKVEDLFIAAKPILVSAP